MTQSQRNARDIRNSWMTTARHWKEQRDAVGVKRCVGMARYWSRELVRRAKV